MNLHLVSLPHTETTYDFSWCAYTQKALKFANMMTELGHNVYLYASENSDARCLETIKCVEPPPDATVTEPVWSTDYFREMNYRVIGEMVQRIEPNDLILLTTGLPQKPIADAFPDNYTVEYGVGYEGTFANFRVFESYAWMHLLAGWNQRLPGRSAMNTDGKFYDTVIPNYFEVDQFPEGDGADGYLLFIGRLIERKGLGIAVDIAKRSGLPLVIAGQGTPPDYGEYYGVVGPEDRAALMGGALAVLTPSLYCEPFCGVAVEAQLCGTPAITTDYGAFAETVLNGITGFRCSTMAEFDQAVMDAKALDRSGIRTRAIAKYSTQAVAPMYERYFERIRDVQQGHGFYEKRT